MSNFNQSGQETVPDKELFIKDRVACYYRQHDYNCAETMLRILSEFFEFNLENQVLDAASGMHGAGRYGAQCGLVEGSLMFLGITGRHKKMPENNIELLCSGFASAFEKRFTSLQCSVLRPGGFNDNDPPHICEKLTCDAVNFSIEYIENKAYNNE